MATFVRSPLDPNGKVPYILDILPHLQMGDSAPLENLRSVLQRWKTRDKPHIIAEAAFGSFDILQEIAEWHGMATMSCPVGTNP